MRDHTKLTAFNLADQLTLTIYRITQTFPREEMFGLVSQMRRAAVSIASNIVEGCARESQAEYVQFLNIAYGSSRELEYQVSLACRLGYIAGGDEVRASCDEVSKVLNGLIRSLRTEPRR